MKRRGVGRVDELERWLRGRDFERDALRFNDDDRRAASAFLEESFFTQESLLFRTSVKRVGVAGACELCGAEFEVELGHART